jgi:hypothetical protein
MGWFMIRFFIILIVAVFSCQKEKTKPTQAAEPTAESLAVPETTEEIVATAETAVTSIMTVDGAKGVFEGGTLAGTIIIPTLTESSYCNLNGEPIHSEAAKNDVAAGVSTMKSSVLEYPGALFYCKLNYNSHTFTTILGANSLAKALLCAAKDSLKSNAAPVRISVKSDNACVIDPALKKQIDLPDSEGGSDGNMQYEIMMVSPSAHKDDFGWDYDVYIGDLGDGSQAKKDAASIRISFKSSDGQAGFAFHTVEPNGSGIGGDTYQLMFSLGSKASLRFETRRQFVECSSSTACTSGARKYTRHTRLIANGKNDSTGAFDSLTSLEGIDSSLDWNTNTALTSNPDAVRISTIRGNSSAGFLTYSMTLSGVMSFPDLLSSLAVSGAIGTTCFGGDSTCSKVTALKPTVDADLAFLLDPRDLNVSKSKAWFLATKPLSFKAISFVDELDN